MSKKITTLLAALAVGCFAVSVSALCPEEDKAAAKAVQRVSADAKAPCAKSADGKAPCGANCPCGKGATTGAKLTGAKAPCGAKLTGGKAPCSKGAKLTGGKAPCHKSAGTAAAHAGDGKMEAILAAMPSIKYQIGSEVTGCSHAATAMAKSAGKPIQYVVGSVVSESEGEAKAKLAALLEKELSSLSSLRYAVGGDCVGCPMTAKSMAKKANKTIAYRVGGFDFADKAKAESVAKLVATAADGVKMSYKVDGKPFCCDKMAGSSAKETGKPMTFVVGADETPCGVSAKLMLTQAKIRAIVAAAAAAIAS